MTTNTSIRRKGNKNICMQLNDIEQKVLNKTNETMIMNTQMEPLCDVS